MRCILGACNPSQPVKLINTLPGHQAGEIWCRFKIFWETRACATVLLWPDGCMNRPAWLVRSRTVFKPVHYDSKLHSVFGNQSDNFLIHFLKSNSQQITNEDSHDHPRPGSRCLVKVLSWRKRRKPVCRWRVSTVQQNRLWIVDQYFQQCLQVRRVL